MATMAHCVLLTGVFLNSLMAITAEWCRTKNSTFPNEYCHNGCCGNSPFEECCDDNEVFEYVVKVLGALFLAAFLIACIVACVCIVKKTKASKGRVINPSQSDGVLFYPADPSHLHSTFQYGYPASNMGTVHSTGGIAPVGTAQHAWGTAPVGTVHHGSGGTSHGIGGTAVSPMAQPVQPPPYAAPSSPPPRYWSAKKKF